jgi:hypothetical protein
MSEYRIFQCKNCAVACCSTPKIAWAKDLVKGVPSQIDLPDNEEIPNLVFPPRNRVELVLEDLEDVAHG